MDVSMVINVQKNNPQSEQAEKSDVTSKAIVQYSEPNVPATFKQLKQDTDLNSAPDNWLQSSLVGKFSEESIEKRNVLDLSSFSMTRNYLDYVGKIDVISDAENIKHLLKTPYSDGSLSMAVHRIRNTLLINELDIPKIISAASEQNPELGPKLEWLKNLYCDVINIPRDRQFAEKNRNKEQAESQNILSKFLQFSIEDAETPEMPSDSSVDFNVKSNFEPQAETFEQLIQPNSLPKTATSSENINFEPKPSFQRNMLWTFEDITMLVGSNMPIFGGGRFPAVSLRLRDAKQPVNILTGLDYWLDNLMCNVPELVMCYHLEGIVQKYEVVKTEDLPKAEGCRFSPKVVKDIAQDVLSFLKSKCTKEGHTYWLFKGTKSDVVKLYDLTSICNEASGDAKNPYTIPVTSLLYRIARNMISNGIRSKKEAVSAISLLQNCILLLERDEHPELMMAANYLLAFLYMQEDFTTEKAETEVDLDEEAPENEDEAEFAGNTEVCKVKSVALLDETKMEKKTPWHESNKEEKCRATISFVIEALKSYGTIYPLSPKLQRSLTYDSPGKSDSTEDREPDTVTCKDSNQSVNSIIPVHDHSVIRLYEEDLEMVAGLQAVSVPDLNWMVQLKIFGLNSYTSLAELSINKGKYGRALRFLMIAFVCMENINHEKSESLMLTHAKITMMCGDISLIFAHKRNVSYEDYKSLNQEDKEFLKLCENRTSTEEDSCYLANIETMFKLDNEQLLIRTVFWYESSLEHSPSNEEKENVMQVCAVTARLGNIRNELGVFYMDAATALMKPYGDPSAEEQQLWRKSFEYFEKGIQAFEVIDDRPNIALIHSNQARLMRTCAKSYGNSTRSGEANSRGSFTQQEKLYFNKAFEFYQKAFTSLRSRQEMPEVWDRVSYDLSSAYFIMACLIQDHPPLHRTSQEEVFKDVQSLMMKALHYYEEEEKNINSPRYKCTRAKIGKIHHRIASLYQHSYRNKYQDVSSKKFRSLAELHYNKAYFYLEEEIFAVEYLSTVTEHIALHIQGVTCTSNYLSNVKKLKAALGQCLKEANVIAIRAVMKYFCEANNEMLAESQRESDMGEHTVEKSSSVNTKELSENVIDMPTLKYMDDYSIEDTFKVLEIFERQLSGILRDLIANLSSKAAKGKPIDTLSIPEVKKMFEIYLRASTKKNHDENILIKLYQKGCLMIDVIEKIMPSARLD